MTPARLQKRQEDQELLRAPCICCNSGKGSSGREDQSSCGKLGWPKVTAKKLYKGLITARHSHLDSCTDLGKHAQAPASWGQSFCSGFAGLAGWLAWLRGQKWVFHLQLDSEQIPTTRTRNRVRARKACFSSSSVLRVSGCHESPLSRAAFVFPFILLFISTSA